MSETCLMPQTERGTECASRVSLPPRLRRQHHHKCSEALHSFPFNINHFTRASSQPAEARPSLARRELKRLGNLSAFLLNLAADRRTDRADGRTREEHPFLLNWPDGNGMEAIPEMSLRFIPSLVTTRSMSGAQHGTGATESRFPS